MTARLEVNLFWYKPPCFYCANQRVLMITSLHLHEKSRGLYQSKVTSSLACIHGQVTKHITVKWSIDSFSCSKRFLIFDRGCQSSGIRFLPFSSLLEEVWTFKYLNSGSTDWLGIGLSVLSVAGPVQTTHRSICYTAVLAQWTIFFFSTWSFQKFGIKLPWVDMLFIEFQDFTDIRLSRHIISVVNWFFHVLGKVFTIKKRVLHVLKHLCECN